MFGKKVELIAAGGMSVIGEKNGLIVAYGQDAIIVDWGQKIPSPDCDMESGPDGELPEEYFPNLDLLQRLRVRGVFFTHGHQDHIGGWHKIYERAPDAPFITHSFTEDVIRLLGRKAGRTRFPSFVHDKIVEIGPFGVTRFSVNHSIVGSSGFEIEVASERKIIKRIVHLGDFKSSHTAIRAHGPVDCLFMDSTNADKPGSVSSKNAVARYLTDVVLPREQGRVFVTLVASNTDRLVPIENYAERAGRRMYIGGSGMQDFVRLDHRISGMKDLRAIEETLIPSPGTWPDNAIIFCTGSQGEPNSFLVRLLEGNFLIPKKSGDVLLVTASAIPNPAVQEQFVRMMEKASRRFERIHLLPSSPQFESAGAEIIRDPNLHTSGHENIGGKKKVHDPLVQNRKDGKTLVIPCHGDRSIRETLGRHVSDWGSEPILMNDGEKITL